MTAVFDRIESAAETVSEIIRLGIIPRTIEYMDNASIQCVESYLKIGLPVDAGAILILEVDGKANETSAAAETLTALCGRKGAKEVKRSETEQARADLWKARKSISPALYKYAPDKINEDIVVPRSRIPEMVRKITELKDQTGLTMASFGHAGDGNIHFNIMLDKRNVDDLKKAEAAVDAVFDYTLRLGGTISGEHGIGITKAGHISKEIGRVELSLMKRIKQLFDPKGVMNPGKIFQVW
jgi:glycolate oxidase